MQLIGNYRINPLIDGQGRQPAAEVFPDTTPEQWEPYRWLLDGNHHLTIAVGAFLVRGHDRTMLIDLGYGPGSLGVIPTGQLLESLLALGVRPAEVTDVLFTHLHRDHVGWASVDGVPQFAHATLRCSAADYRYFIEEGNGDPSIGERLRPCDAHVETFDGDVGLPAITTLHAPGHTPGSTVFVFSSGTDRVIVLGDVVHSPVQLLEPDWNTLNDVDPVLARRTRQRLLQALDGDGEGPPRMAAMHFPGLRFGRLVSAAGRRRWVV